MKRTLGSWGADSSKVCLVVTTTGAAPMPECIGGGARTPLSRVVVSQLQGETLRDLQTRLEHRLGVLGSRHQSVESAVLMVGPILSEGAEALRTLVLVLSESLDPAGELSLVTQRSAPEPVRTELFALFDAVAAYQHGSKKGVTIRFLAAVGEQSEERSGVWACPAALDSDADVA